MEDASADKQELRSRLLERRVAIPEDAWRRKSDAILRRLQEEEAFGAAETIHCYISMNGRREPDTHPLLQSLLKEGRRVAVPVTQFGSGTLNHVRLTDWEELEPNRWGVPEPPGGERVDPGEPDLVIVPMVGGDRNRNRLGYGKGFYDRFLQGVDGMKLGLLFEEGLVERVPTEPFDVPLDRIVTDERVI